MERKKTHSPKKRAVRSKARSKKAGLFLRELKTNLVLAAVIFGFCLALLLGRFVLWPVGESGVVSLPPVAEPSPTVQAPVPVAPAPAPPAPPPAVTSVPKTPSAAPVKRPLATTPEKPMVERSRPAPAALRSPPEQPVPPRTKGSLILVFDDAGHNLDQLQKFLDLPFPCTIAVLPGLQYSKEAARRIRASGKECILHQPMQAINLDMDPGPGAIKPGMGADTIRDIVRKNLADIGPVAGMNNHEGSLISADRDAMAAVLDVALEAGIYYLDSRTNAKTAVPAIARDRKMTIWERAVFLDNSQDRMMIMDAISSGMKIAERKGSAIMIGHIWSNDLADILTEMYPELVSQGFSLSTIARLATEAEDF